MNRMRDIKREVIVIDGKTVGEFQSERRGQSGFTW